MRLLRHDAPSRVTIPVVGPEPLTFRQFLETIRLWLGLAPGPTLTIPMWLMRLVARVGDVVRSEFVNADTLAMLCRGNTAAQPPFLTVTGVEPRPLSKGLPSVGASRSEYLAATLYFLQPLLRISIAAVWIGSGVVSLFFYPRETSEDWLVRMGIPGAWTGMTLVAAAGLDIGLGLDSLLRRRLPLLLTLRLSLILVFSSF